MSKFQSAGLILLCIHIGLHVLGFYAWLSQPTYDVFVMSGKTGYIISHVRIDPGDVAIKGDSTLVLHRGLGDDILIEKYDRAEVVTVNLPVWSKLFGYGR